MRLPVISVLLVEDDTSIADLYAFKLRMDGYAVHQAGDGFSAELIFDRTNPRVVCIDSRLPDGSGAQLAGKLAKRGAEVILFTNDQESFERPPAGISKALLKSRTNPGQLSVAISEIVARTGAY